MIGLALAGFVTVLATSTKAYIDGEAARAPDLRVSSPRVEGGEPSPISPEVVVRIGALREVADVVALTGTEGRAAGAVAGVVGVDPAAYLRIQGLQVVAGRATDLGPGGIAVSERVATQHGWRIGSPVVIEVGGARRQLTVRSVHRDGYYIPGPPEYLVATSDYAALGGDARSFALIIRTAPGVAPAAARAAVDLVLRDNPSPLVVEDRDQVRREALGQIDTVASIYLALTALAALIGLFGITNTMGLSIVDRIREIGLLRAIGMARRQVRSMVRVEAVVIAGVGAGLGLGVGLLFGWGAATVFNHSSAPTAFTVPAAQLGLMAAVAVAVGVAAAVGPARLASRVDVLRAIAVE
jgi:putative ABC transport system permease protein